MLQIFNNFRTGEVELKELPTPKVSEKFVLSHTRCSLISAGTERMLIDFAKSSYLAKAKKQPQKVIQVVNKIKTDGLVDTINAVGSQLNKPIPMGYSNVGVVLESKSVRFKVGDRIVSNGPHAEQVAVNHNLAAKIPDNVSDEEASFSVLGAIALQGLRLAEPKLGEKFAVIGCGLVGLLAVQLLRSNGCDVVAIEPNAKRTSLAINFGAKAPSDISDEKVIAYCENLTDGNGLDGVIICASASKSDVIQLAARLCRKRGRIISVGVTGLNLDRNLFYDKELLFQVSCSYGPGRYEQDYEVLGNDYPYAFVRFTEQRNIQTVLDLLSQNKIDVKSLIDEYFEIQDAAAAYSILLSQKETNGIILRYSASKAQRRVGKVFSKTDSGKFSENNKFNLGVIGAGRYAQFLVPIFLKHGFCVSGIYAPSGVNAFDLQNKSKAKYITTDKDTVFNDPNIGTIVVLSTHDDHCRSIVSALRMDKNVYVEKPIALTLEEIDQIEDALGNSKGSMVVGFNRRFSTHVDFIKANMAIDQPSSFQFSMNSGFVPKDHWLQNIKIGGGRIIGEAVHYIDLMQYMSGSDIVDFSVNYLNIGSQKVGDVATINLVFNNGSIGNINYFSNGNKSYPKEKLEVYAGEKIGIINNFFKTEIYGSKKSKFKTFNQQKGQREFIKSFAEFLNGKGEHPTPMKQVILASKIAVKCANG